MRELPEDLVLPEAMAPVRTAGVPAVPKDAATVMLIRDGAVKNGAVKNDAVKNDAAKNDAAKNDAAKNGAGEDGNDREDGEDRASKQAPGLEVFLLRRVAGMAFAGGMTVFPGGGVDPRDADTSVAWTGPEPGWWAERFGCTPSLARALVCAAVRETFEEAGVLLAGPTDGGIVADTARFAAARQALVDRDFSLAEFLTANGLVLRADLLRPWANWVTPAEEARRYDTRFFLAELPAGQRADGVTTEADHAGWRRPADAIEDWKAGRRGLLPPTWIALSELAEFATVAEATSAARDIEKVIPKVIRDGGALRVVLPGDPRFDAAAGHLDARPGDRLEMP